MCELFFEDFKQLPGVRFVHCDILLKENPSLPEVSTDSRTLAAGQVFWVLKGERFDGHDFVPVAAQKGALCAVVERRIENLADFPQVVVPDALKALQQLAALKRSRFKGVVLGLTGSNGKTTTKEMIAHILSQKYQVHKTRGNLNNHIGCPLTLLQLRSEHRFAVVEMGTNHPGEIAALAEIVKPDAALITNIGPAHIEFFKTLEAVAKEKLSLFEALGSGQTAFVNVDDPFLRAWQKSGVERLTFGFDFPAKVRGEQIEISEAGFPRFYLNGKTLVQLSVPGVHNARNALSAAAVALHFGFSEDEIAAALQDYTAFDKRMQVIEINGLRVINDAYNANPQSFKAAFETLSRMARPAGLFLVMGDMFELGESAGEWHKQILEQALQLNPTAVLLMGAAFEKAANQVGDSRVQVFKSHRVLGETLKKSAQPGALIFVKGSRGMEMEKILEFI